MPANDTPPLTRRFVAYPLYAAGKRRSVFAKDSEEVERKILQERPGWKTLGRLCIKPA